MRLIDADKLLDTLGIDSLDCEKCSWGNFDYCKRGSDFVDACSAIEDAPTVDAEPVRHGRWDTKYLSEDEDWSGIEHTIGRCSVCGGKVDIAGKRIPYLYCPFCGAKLDEVEDG